MAYFKVGDRVRVIKEMYGDASKLGELGTVVEDYSTCPWVRYDQPVNRSYIPEYDHKVSMNDWLGPHMECPDEHQLELVSQPEDVLVLSDLPKLAGQGAW